MFRVLIVDDDPDCAGILAELITDEFGAECDSVLDARLAVSTATDVSPDVVILDLHMPHLSGRQVARDLRAGPCPTTPIVIHSALTDNQRHAAELGERYCLPKPFEAAELFAVLRACLSLT